MLKKDVISLYNGIHAVMTMPGVVFGYALNINLKRIQPEIDSLQKAITPSEKFLEYDNKRVEIVKKYALKDEKGEYVMITLGSKSSFDVKGNEEVVEKEVGVLKAEYKQAIEDQDKQIAEYNKLLEEDVKIDLYKVKLENVPKEITADQMNAIFPIIDGE